MPNWGFERFANPAALEADIADVLYRWAGVDGISPTARGPNIDARKLGFLEALFGKEFLQWGTVPNPYEEAGALLEAAWGDVYGNFASHIMIQAGAASLFNGAASYDLAAGELTGAMDLVESEIDALVPFATANGVNTLDYWLRIADLIEFTKGLANLSGTEEGWLDTALYDSGLTETWDDIVSQYQFLDNTGITEYGTSGNDTIDGTVGDDSLYGQGGTDVISAGDGDDLIKSTSGSWGNDSAGDELHGGHGNDVIHGSAGDDSLSAGPGGDFVFGYDGDDTYSYTGGDDVYEDSFNSADKIILPSGISANDLQFHIVNGDDLLIEVDDLGTITIVNQLQQGGSGAIETIEFDDTPTLNLMTIPTPAQYGTDGADTIYGITAGTGDYDDRIYALGGDDILNGYGGTNVLDGGAGNDTIYSSGTFDTIIASPDHLNKSIFINRDS